MELKQAISANVVPFVISIIAGYFCGVFAPNMPPMVGVLLLLVGAAAITSVRLAFSKAPRVVTYVYGAALALGWNVGYLAYVAQIFLRG